MEATDHHGETSHQSQPADNPKHGFKRERVSQALPKRGQKRTARDEEAVDAMSEGAGKDEIGALPGSKRARIGPGDAEGVLLKLHRKASQLSRTLFFPPPPF